MYAIIETGGKVRVVGSKIYVEKLAEVGAAITLDKVP